MAREFKGAIKRVKRVELPGSVVVLDAPRESPLMTWSSRWEKLFDFRFDLPLLGDYYRHYERRQWVRTARGSAMSTVVFCTAFALLFGWWGKWPTALTMAAFAVFAGGLLAWPKVMRIQLELSPAGWVVRRKGLLGASEVARGQLDHLDGVEIERLDTRRLQESESMADDRVCLYLEQGDSKVLLGSGLSSAEARWFIRQVDTTLEGRGALPGAAAPNRMLV